MIRILLFEGAYGRGLFLWKHLCTANSLREGSDPPLEIIQTCQISIPFYGGSQNRGVGDCSDDFRIMCTFQ